MSINLGNYYVRRDYKVQFAKINYFFDVECRASWLICAKYPVLDDM